MRQYIKLIAFISLWIILATSLSRKLPGEVSFKEPGYSSPTNSPRTAEEVIQIIENWFYPHYINDQLVWEATGKVARIMAQREIMVESIEIIYHLKKKTGDVKLIKFIANKGIIKKDENIAIFQENVRVETSDRIVLTTTNLSSTLFPNENEIIISSEETVTFTNSADIIITGKGFYGKTLMDSTGNLKIGYKNKAYIKKLASCENSNNLEITAQEIKLTTSEPQSLNDSSPITIILKGKKQIVFLGKQGRIYISSKGNTLIYPGFQRIFFQDQIQLIHLEEAIIDNQSITSETGRLICDRLNLFIKPASNELKKVLAEQNVILFEKNGGQALAQFLEWHLENRTIILKSIPLIKVWHQNRVLSADDRVIITTSTDKPATLGNWENIKVLNRTLGAIKFPKHR